MIEQGFAKKGGAVDEYDEEVGTVAIPAHTAYVDCTTARISGFKKTSIVLDQHIRGGMAETKSAKKLN